MVNRYTTLLLPVLIIHVRIKCPGFDTIQLNITTHKLDRKENYSTRNHFTKHITAYEEQNGKLFPSNVAIWVAANHYKNLLMLYFI